MYMQDVTNVSLTTTLVQIKYDCCGVERSMKWVDAKKNFEKNGGKHICRPCFLKKNNPAKSAAVQEKIKKTNLERYGSTMPVNSAENITQRVEKMFGDQEAKQRIVEKRKQTSREKYGADHIMQTEEGVERVKKAMQEKYGVDHPLQSDEIKEKMRQTCQQRYGKDNPCQVPEVRMKMAQTTLERYGVEHYNQLPQMKDYLRENCKDWLAESWANPWAKGITRPEEWNKKQSDTMVRLLLEGKLVCSHKGSVRGYYISEKCKNKKAFFRSHLELLVHHHLHMNDDVSHYQYEPFAIPILDAHGRERLYVPDFMVFFLSKTQPVIIECKPEYMMAKGDNPHKFEAMNEHAEANDLVFEVWSEKRIHQFADYKKLLNSDRVIRI